MLEQVLVLGRFDQAEVDAGGRGHAVELELDGELVGVVFLVLVISVARPFASTSAWTFFILFLSLRDSRPVDALLDEEVDEDPGVVLPLEDLDVALLLHDPEEELAELLALEDLLAALDPDLEVLGDLLDEPLLVGPLLLEVEDLPAAGDLVERRLGDVEVALLDEGLHLAVEEGHEQGPDVRPVDVGVGHDDDLVVAELLQAEVGLPEVRPQGGDQHPDVVVLEDLVRPGLLDVEDLAPERQDGLEAAVAALLGRAAGGIALDDVDLGQGRVALLAVGELARAGPRIRGRSSGGPARGPCGRRRGPGPRRRPSG